MSGEKVFSVSDINTRVQAIVQSETIGKPFWAAGVVKGKYQSDRGHIYFRLEDDPWSIHCMIPESLRGEMAFTVQNRMEVEVYGDIRVYDRQARIEIQVQRVKLIERPSIPDFRDTEAYLRSKGLWGLPKKDLPKEPKRIVLITSMSSRAVEDFKQAYNRNAVPEQAAEIFVEDVPIEGEFAPARIAEAIEKVSNARTADIIVITRGGGRKTKLAVFNDPIIAEAICRADIPIISAIGHEEDQVFADIVADVRASTPTDAATRILEAQKSSGCGLLTASILFLTAGISTSMFALWAVQHLL